MMPTIYKYPLNMDDVIKVQMPEGAKVLTVQMQGGSPYIWAGVDPDAPKVERRFRMYGTGHPIDPNLSLEYINTFQMHGGALIFHLFEDLTAEALDSATILELEAKQD